MSFKYMHKKIRHLLKELYVMIRSNHIVGKYLNIPQQKKRVNIHQYHPKTIYNNIGLEKDFNLGDSLGEVIVKYLLKEKGIDYRRETSATHYFYCVGSNILASYQNATVWGSGILPLQSRVEKMMHKICCRKLDVRAVRGPLTKKVLEDYGFQCPEVYGDPAILMPMIYNPIVNKKNTQRLVIPQFYNESELRRLYPSERMITMNTNDYKSVIDEIVSSEIVYTSSLHGIILAESYGVPAVFFRSLPQWVDFKYLDYYYSTGRENIKIAESFEEALKMDPLPLPDLTELRKGILQTFPYDLWEN